MKTKPKIKKQRTLLEVFKNASKKQLQLLEKSDGALMIETERYRQILDEGYCEDHDDRHDDGELIAAAICYCEAADRISNDWPDYERIPNAWPWKSEDWKPKDNIRDLVRAGALIAAEIDRLQRKGTKL